MTDEEINEMLEKEYQEYQRKQRQREEQELIVEDAIHCGLIKRKASL